MQYLLKITVLGLTERVWRLVSLEGKADVAHTMALCNLAFDYANYEDGAFYLPKSGKLKRALACLSNDEDLASYCQELKVPGKAWYEPLISDLADSMKWSSYQATEQSSAITALDTVLEPELCVPFASDIAPYFDAQGYDVKPAFIYVVHGVQHLVEVMRREEKLACFIPATLMGAVPISAHGLPGEPEELSYKLLSQELNALERALDERAQEVERREALGESVDPNWEHEFSLNLKECTSRLRALGAMRSNKEINQSLLQAGSAALKVRTL